VQFNLERIAQRPGFLGTRGGSLEHIFAATLSQARLDPACKALGPHYVLPLGTVSMRIYSLDKAMQGMRTAPGEERIAVMVLGLETPPGEPPSEEGQAFIAKHRAIGQGRGKEFTTVAEVLADLLAYPQVAALLEKVGFTSQGLARLLAPYLTGAMPPPPPPGTKRFQEVSSELDLHSDASRRALDGFQLVSGAETTMRLAQSTMALEHLYLGALRQLRRERGGEALGFGVSLEKIEEDLSNALTVRTPPPFQAVWTDPVDGERLVQGIVPESHVLVPPEVQEFLHRHRQTARQRGHQFTTVFEVAHDLLDYPQVRALVREAGHDPLDLRRRMEPLLPQG
jgi:hypothetical protein